MGEMADWVTSGDEDYDNWDDWDDDDDDLTDEPHIWRMLAAVWQRIMVEFRYWGGSNPSAGRRVTPGSVSTMVGIIEINAEGFCHRHAGMRWQWPRFF